MPTFIFYAPQKMFIEEAIDSIINQTYQDWELIIVDDGSFLKFDDVIPDDDRIKVYRKKHEGVAKARNFGIKKMTGDVYMAHDSDDSSDPRRLDLMLKEINKGYDAVYHGFHRVSMDEKEPRTKSAEPFDYERLKKEQYIPYFVMVRKDKMVPYRDKYTSSDDWMFLIDLVENGAKFGYVDKPLMIYRKHPMSVSCLSMYDGRKKKELNWIKKDIKKLKA